MKGLNFKISATNGTAPAFNAVKSGLQGVQRSANAAVRSTGAFGAGVAQNKRAIQQFGFQASDFAVQIAGGQSAMLAFTQQGGQMLQFFGPAGAMLALLVTIFGTLAIMLSKSGKSLADITPIMGVLQEQLRGFGEILKVVAEAAIDFANIIVNNLDTIAIAAGIVAGYFATKWVASMVTASLATGRFGLILTATGFAYQTLGVRAAAATFATHTFTVALMALRSVMMTLGIPALVIGLSYAIERFLTLKKGAGSFGEAMTLLGNLARAVWSEMGDIMGAFGLKVQAVAYSMQASFVRALAGMLDAVDDFLDVIISGPFNAVMKAVGSDFEIASSRRSQNNLRALAGEYTALGNSAARSAALQIGAATQTADALGKLKDAIAKGEDSKIDVRDWFGNGKDKDDGKGGSGGAKAKAEKDAKDITTIFEDMRKSIGQSMLSGFKALTDGSKSFADVAKGILGDILDKVVDILMTPIFNNIAGGIAGGILGGLGIDGTKEMPSFAGGGYTWSGARAGGVDGKGGRPAILHPNETVIDHTKGGGGQAVNVRVSFDSDAGFRAYVEDTVRGGVGQYDRSLPDRMAQIQQDGKFR